MKFLIVFICSVILIPITQMEGVGFRASSLSNVQMSNDFYLEIERTPCFGSCPIYKIKIDSTGTLYWNGKRYTSKIGNWKRTLSGSEQMELHSRMKQIRLSQFQSRYDSPEITDLPSVNIRWREHGKMKHITDRSGAPEALHKFEKYVESLAIKPGLIFVSDNEDE